MCAAPRPSPLWVPGLSVNAYGGGLARSTKLYSVWPRRPVQDTYESEYVEESGGPPRVPEAEMAVKVISLRSMTVTMQKALVEAEAVYVFVLGVCVCARLSCALWFRARTAGNSHLATAAPTWYQDGCSQVFTTLGDHKQSIHGEITGGINRQLVFL